MSWSKKWEGWSEKMVRVIENEPPARKKTIPCLYNIGVGCDDLGNCKKCGGNPQVEVKRKAIARRRWEKLING